MRYAILLTLPALAWASDLEVLTLPNGQRVPVGERAMLEGGAVVAQVSGPGAIFANPAGLADLERPTVSGSMTLLEYSRMGSRTTGGTQASADNTAIKPNLVGFASAMSEDDPGTGWGFSLASPVTWSSALQVRTITATGARRDDGRSSLDMLVPGLGFGWSPSETLRTGFALELWLTDYRFDSGTSAHEGANVLTSTYSENGRQFSLRFTLGAQYHRGRWSIGALLRSPGLAISSQGEISASTTSGDGTSTVFTEVDEQQAGFKVPLPLTATIGIAWQPEFLDGLAIEADLGFTAGGPEVEVFAAATGSTTTVSGGPPTIVSFTQAERRLDPHWVLNPRLGLSWRLPQPVFNRTLRLHLGAYMDRSPVGESDVFTHLDLLGGTAGVSLERGALRTSLGAVYVTSSSITDALNYVTSPSSGFTPSLADPGTNFAVRSFILAIGTSYRF